MATFRYVLLMGLVLNIYNVRAADKAEESLVRATEVYGSALERYRKAVGVALDRAEVQARAAGPEQVAAVASQKRLFQEFGFTPALCSNSLWAQRASAHKRLVKAHQLAIRDYTRQKDDEKAKYVREKLNAFWPAFWDDPTTGGWAPLGAARIEIQDGIVALSPGRGRSGLITNRKDLASPNLEFELAGSHDVNAWIGVQMTRAQGKPVGATCQIRAEDGGVKPGFWSKDYVARDDDGRKPVLKPYEFFKEKINCKFDKFSLHLFVNDKPTHLVGGQTHIQFPGATSIVVDRGVLLIKSVSQDGGNN